MTARWSEQEYEDYRRRRNTPPLPTVGESGETPTCRVGFIQTGENPPADYVLSRSGNPAYRLIVVHGAPVAKPRQTQCDKWKKRPAVVRYREWADRARQCAGEMPAKPGQMDVKFFLPIPTSWSEKKRAAHRGLPHQVKPDKDNLEKAVADALLKNDQCIWKGRQEKRWDDGNGPRVEITIY